MNLTSKNLILLNEVESTNNYANQLVLSKAAEHGTVVLAQYQKKGRGQQGNFWESEFGKNMLASFIVFPQFLSAAKQFYFSKIVSLALVDFLKTETNEVSVKWPNDIYVRNKKIAGILIENSIKGSNLSSAVIGIGSFTTYKGVSANKMGAAVVLNHSAKSGWLTPSERSICTLTRP